MTDINLPPLPRCARMANLPGTDEYACEPVFTADQMRAFARAAVLADREQRSEPVAWMHPTARDCTTTHPREKTLAAQVGPENELSNVMLRQLAELGFGECAAALRSEGQS